MKKVLIPIDWSENAEKAFDCKYCLDLNVIPFRQRTGVLRTNRIDVFRSAEASFRVHTL